MTMKIHIVRSAVLIFMSVGVVQSADVTYMKASITSHLSDNRHHEINPAYKDAARQYVFDELTRHGFEVSYHNFTTTRFPGAQFSNVIGVRKGTNFGTVNDKLIGVGAHYDTVRTTKGVDDNGAGVAAMLEVAKQLTMPSSTSSGFEHTIVMMSYDLEEEGYIGSDMFITDWFPKWTQANYGAGALQLSPYGAIIMDTMMEYNTSKNSQQLPLGTQQAFPQSYNSISGDQFEGDFLALVYRAPTGDAKLSSAFQQAWNARGHPEYQLETFPLPYSTMAQLYMFGDFLRSDHRRFWEYGYPAVFLTDSGNFRGDMKQCYHHECDDLATMLTDDNINFLSKTADSISRAVKQLARPISVSPVG